jgi:hypothetical protein
MAIESERPNFEGVPSMSHYRAVDFEARTIRIFGERDIAPALSSDGWASPEEGHVWNDGTEATLTISHPIENEACLITFSGRPFVNHVHPSQEITLYVNGLRLGCWTLDESRLYTLQAVIEPEQWLRRNGIGILKCTWHLPDSVRPVDVGAGSDHRRLGFCFQAIGLQTLAE